MATESRTVRVRRTWLDKLQFWQRAYQTKIFDECREVYGRGLTREASIEAAKRRWESEQGGETTFRPLNALAKAGIELGDNGSIYPRPKGKDYRAVRTTGGEWVLSRPPRGVGKLKVGSCFYLRRRQDFGVFVVAPPTVSSVAPCP
jgi:hypothetical protein